jgi:protein-tyrosine phosphatase
MGMLRGLRYAAGAGIALLVIGLPLLYHRYQRTTFKRLKTVVPGKLYRSGQMTADGLRQTVRRLGIRTVINVQNEFPDPVLRRSFLNGETINESEVCNGEGVRYVALQPDLVPPCRIPAERPRVLGPYLALLDEPANYPILLHCKAGLHRTGILSAVYRMEYQGWSAAEALEELKNAGFGDSEATSANDYVYQYVLTYRPRVRGHAATKGADR